MRKALPYAIVAIALYYATLGALALLGFAALLWLSGIGPGAWL